jgi:probable F420-dependent oxidoreductase
MAARARIGVSLGYWQDREPLEALETAQLADDLGYDELWLGEMATFDAFALATAVGLRTNRIPLTVGPLAVAVRDAMALAMGIASVAALTEREVHLAVGTSSPVLVERWHGRSAASGGRLLRETAAAVRPLLGGERAPSGYRLRLPTPVPAASITVAAFGPAAVRTAAEAGDRMVVNLCSPEQVGMLRDALEAASAACGRACPPLAAWVPAAVDPDEETMLQLRGALVSYVAAPGYGEMFDRAGFGATVAFARDGAHPRDLLDRMPAELVEVIGVIGDEAACAARLGAFFDAGADEVALVAATAGDPGGRRTLTALAPRRGT